MLKYAVSGHMLMWDVISQWAHVHRAAQAHVEAHAPCAHVALAPHAQMRNMLMWCTA